MGHQWCADVFCGARGGFCGVRLGETAAGTVVGFATKDYGVAFLLEWVVFMLVRVVVLG